MDCGQKPCFMRENAIERNCIFLRQVAFSWMFLWTRLLMKFSLATCWLLVVCRSSDRLIAYYRVVTYIYSSFCIIRLTLFPLIHHLHRYMLKWLEKNWPKHTPFTKSHSKNVALYQIKEYIVQTVEVIVVLIQAFNFQLQLFCSFCGRWYKKGFSDCLSAV